MLFFKGRRNGFMPEYLDHPVKDMKTWEENVQVAPEPGLPGALRRSRKAHGRRPRAAAAEGRSSFSTSVGGYMYLRSLIGPMDLLYAFYDQPDLIHDCMKTWFELADAVTPGTSSTSPSTRSSSARTSATTTAR